MSKVYMKNMVATHPDSTHPTQLIPDMFFDTIFIGNYKFRPASSNKSELKPVRPSRQPTRFNLSLLSSKLKSIKSKLRPLSSIRFLTGLILRLIKLRLVSFNRSKLMPVI
jgi:hypothetical protein